MPSAKLGGALAHASSRGKLGGDIEQGMIDRRPMRMIPVLIASLAMITIVPANAFDGGMLKTLPRGEYHCALPGHAGKAPLKTIIAEGFTIGASSSYSSTEGRGIYLLRGKNFTFTSGPKRGQRFRQTGTHELQKIESDGSLGRMICSRTGG